MTKRFTKSVKKRIVKTLIWSVAMYACKTWTLRTKEIDRLNALEMWIWRRVEKVSWLEKKTNEHVLHEVREKKFLGKSSRRKKN